MDTLFDERGYSRNQLKGKLKAIRARRMESIARFGEGGFGLVHPLQEQQYQDLSVSNRAIKTRQIINSKPRVERTRV